MTRRLPGAPNSAETKMKSTALPPVPAWTAIAGFNDIIYEKCDDGIAKITINRPEVRNAFRPQTVQRAATAFDDARDDAGHRRDHPHRPGQGRVLLRRRPARARPRRLRRRRRRARVSTCSTCSARSARCPKPVVAMVAGYAIGGGHVLHVVCDLTIAADNARFGQTGPKVGSFDGGFGAQLPGAHRRPEEGARNLVPLPAVRREAGAGHGAGQHRRAVRTARSRDPASGAARCSP